VSAHDDYLDVKDAYLKWERAYVKYGKAADSKDRDPDQSAEKRVKADKKAKRAADIYLVACDYLARMAAKARASMIDYGWGRIPKTVKNKKGKK
jgi:hypothetical protein